MKFAVNPVLHHHRRTTDSTRRYPRNLDHLFHHAAVGITLTSAKGPCHYPGSLIQVEPVESVEFVGGFNERGGTEMRVAERSLAYRGAAQRRIRPEAQRGWAGFGSCAMSLSWAKTINTGSPSTG
jgi:hypothetical protein